MARKPVVPLGHHGLERPVPRLPHPSWRRAVAGGDGHGHPPLTADDFWTRLGA
ncbi:hypothetical protein [Novosphingobium sp.]|uniref:hypothetical protein n=1 Tax=Novosphingobium sp. TaxID=1874826 RepID=UPI00334225CA